VSTRNVAGLGEVKVKGLSKSAVSRIWQDKAKAVVGQVQQSDLSKFDLLLLMIDAVVLAKGVVAIVALGIDAAGHKKVPGYRVGGSDNREVCSDYQRHPKRIQEPVPSSGPGVPVAGEHRPSRSLDGQWTDAGPTPLPEGSRPRRLRPIDRSAATAGGTGGMKSSPVVATLTRRTFGTGSHSAPPLPDNEEPSQH
jgi:hypothetical protein